MGNMDGWDIALLAAAAYVAVTALVRLMARRRNQLIEQLRQQAEDEPAPSRDGRQRKSA
jgi:hypothetical protein